MIKAVFFDLFHTLIHYDPPREEVLQQSLLRRGISASLANLRQAIITGDEYFYHENARKGLSERTEAETREMWGHYQAIVLKEAGIEPTDITIPVNASLSGAYIEGHITRLRIGGVTLKVRQAFLRANTFMLGVMYPES